MNFLWAFGSVIPLPITLFQLRAAFCALPLMPSLQFRAEHFFAVNIGNKSLAKLLFSQTLMHNSDAAQSARKVAIV